MTKINIVQDWPSAVPRILAVPTGAMDIPHHGVTPSEIVDALAVMAECAPGDPDWWQHAVTSLRSEVEANRHGGAMFVLWNIASAWGFKHGAFAGKNGEASGKFEARAPQRKGGGRKENSGRKKAVANDDVLCSAYDDAKSAKGAELMKVKEVRKKAVKKLKSAGYHANITAIAEALARRRKHVGNR